MLEAAEEPVDPQLESKLEQLQAETDSLLVEVACLRRTCPEHIRQRFSLDVDDLERVVPGAVIRPESSPHQIQTEMDESVVSRLTTTLGELRSLSQSIPELVAKLKRAQAVLLDGSTKEGGSGGAVNTVHDHLNEMMNKQRRITRQHDLAAKLLAQQ